MEGQNPSWIHTYIILTPFNSTFIDIFNVIGFIWATDQVVTMLCHVTKKIVDGKNISSSIDTNWFKPNFTCLLG